MKAASAPTPDLSGMTKAELLDYAEEKGVGTVNSSMKKADILAALEGI